MTKYPNFSTKLKSMPPKTTLKSPKNSTVNLTVPRRSGRVVEKNAKKLSAHPPNSNNDQQEKISDNTAVIRQNNKAVISSLSAIENN